MVARFAERAFRRPVQPDELDRVFAAFRMAHDRGESFERCIQVALTAVLASPRFLFRVEPEEGGDRPLTQFELASRLSYFLWSTMPDDKRPAGPSRDTPRPTSDARSVGCSMIPDRPGSSRISPASGSSSGSSTLRTPSRDLFPGFGESPSAARAA